MATLLWMPNPVRSSQKAQPAPFPGSILLPSVHGCEAELAEPYTSIGRLVTPF